MKDDTLELQARPDKNTAEQSEATTLTEAGEPSHEQLTRFVRHVALVADD